MFEACLDRRLANTFVSFGANLLPSGGSFSSLPGRAIMPSTDRNVPLIVEPQTHFPHSGRCTAGSPLTHSQKSRRFLLNHPLLLPIPIRFFNLPDPL